MRRAGWLLAPFVMLAACETVADAPAEAPTVTEEAVRPPPGSNEMLRANLSHDPHLEVIISDVVIPAGATVPRHYHPGEEFIYVIEGSAVHVEEGKPDQILSAGDSYVIPPDAVHAPRGGPEGARAIVFRVHRDGLPERINKGERGPIPDFQEFDYQVESDQILTLMDNIESRGDYHCHPMSRPAVMCHLDTGREVYVFTEPGDRAHISALFRGFVRGNDGTPVLAERGWSTAVEDVAQSFFTSITAWPVSDAED